MKLAYKTKPYPHQVRALKKLLRNRGGGLQVPMRWGKSWVGVNYAGAGYHLWNFRRVLVVTVTSGLGVWESQVAEHCPVPWTTQVYGAKLFTVSDPTASKHLEFLIVNYENLFTRDYPRNKAGEVTSKEWTPASNQTLIDFDADLVIADESHHLGDPSIVQSIEARRIARDARSRVFMTGSMFHRKPFFVFGQLLFYDDGSALGSSWPQYKKRISVMGGYGGYEVLKYRNLQWMVKRVKPHVYMEKYVPPRNAVKNIINFDLTGRNLDYYAKMALSGGVKHEGKFALAPIILTRHLRLLQLCGGFLSMDGRVSQVGKDKLNTFIDRLREYREQDIDKAVVGCRFLPELAATARAAKKLGFLPVLFHGAVPKGDERTRRVALFQETSKPALFISQIAAGKESIDLSAASVMMFFSLTESFVDYDQFSKRIEKFKETRTLMYDYMIANGTRDEITLAALALSQNVAEYMVSHPERVEEIATIENRKKVAA